MTKSLSIKIEVIPPEHQRYPTTGDWILNEQPNGNTEIQVFVSKLDSWQMETLIGLHEAIEAVLCISSGVDPVKVDKFDVAFEKSVAAGHSYLECGCSNSGEPGDDHHAPYYRQHQLATSVERLLAAELGVAWSKYEDACFEAHARTLKPGWQAAADRATDPPKEAPLPAWKVNEIILNKWRKGENI